MRKDGREVSSVTIHNDQIQNLARVRENLFVEKQQTDDGNLYFITIRDKATGEVTIVKSDKVSQKAVSLSHTMAFLIQTYMEQYHS